MRYIVLASCLALFFSGCTSSQPKAANPYEASILSRPMPKDETSRVQECTSLHAEIMRQQASANYTVSTAPRNMATMVLNEAHRNISLLQARWAKLECNVPRRDALPPATP